MREERWQFWLFVVALAFGLLYFVLPEPWAQPALHLSSVALGLGLAILIVNIILQRETQRRAVAAFRVLIGQSIEGFLARARRNGERVFGEDKFKEVLKKHILGGENALSDEECAKVTDVYWRERADFESLLKHLLSDLKELSTALGSSLAPAILGRTYMARHAIETVLATAAAASVGTPPLPSEDQRRDIARGFLKTYLLVDEVDQMLKRVIRGDWRAAGS